MKLWVSSGSLEMSDIMKIWGLVSMWIAGGHCWAMAVARPASSRMLLRGSMVGEIESDILDQQDYGGAVVLRTI